MGAKKERIAELELEVESLKRALNEQRDTYAESKTKILGELEERRAQLEPLSIELGLEIQKRSQAENDLAAARVELAAAIEAAKKAQKDAEQLAIDLQETKSELGGDRDDAVERLSILEGEIKSRFEPVLARRGCKVSAEDPHTLARSLVVEAACQLEVLRDAPEAALRKELDRANKKIEQLEKKEERANA